MSWKKNVTREGMITAVLACMEKVGHVPNVSELEKHTDITRHDMIGLFGSYAATLKECGLKRTGSGMRIESKDLFLDWAKVVRALKRIPKLHEYELDGLHSEVPFRKRFGTWSNVPKAMKRYALENGLAEEWQDVIELIDSHLQSKKDGQSKRNGQQEEWNRPKAKVRADRPVYGRLLRPSPLVCAPVNEAGVIFLFGAMAEQMGFQMLRIQAGFPDGEALRTMEENRLQRVKIEFEYESRNFLHHGHDAAFCDLIICWEDNWPDAPVEVIELKRAFN